MSDKIVINLSKNMAEAGKGLPFRGDFSLNSSVLPYPNAELKGISVDFVVTFLNPDVHVKGNIACFIDGQCDKCLADVSTKIDVPFDQIFYKDIASEPDAYVYLDGNADITDAVRDEACLGLPTSLLCRDDCKGLCPKCGADRNVTECDCDTTKENAFSFLKNLKF